MMVTAHNPPVHAPFTLMTTPRTWNAQGECNQWKLRFAVNLHARAKDELERLTEYIRVRADCVLSRAARTHARTPPLIQPRAPTDR